ncbi:hypothetical protein Efla_000728 [Eimeria flavescens]
MFFEKDGAGRRSAYELPKARFSLRVSEGPSLLSLLHRALSRHPFNQQIFLVTAERPRGHPSSSSAAVKEAVGKVAAGTCCICLRHVCAASFLSLPLQQLLIKQLQGSALSWRGPGASAPCPAAAATADAAPLNACCPVAGDGGADRNVAALQSNGVLILKVDWLTAQVLGLETRLQLPHFLKRTLPRGTSYLKLDVQHPAVLRHQRMHQKQLQKPREAEGEAPGQPAGRCCRPPSPLFKQLQRALKSLEPMDFLAALRPPEQEGDAALQKRFSLAQQLQAALRASGSEAAACHLVQLQCLLSVYQGGIVDMTGEAALAAAAEEAVNAYEGSEVLMPAADLPPTQMPRPLLLPDWGKLFELAAAAALQQQRSEKDEGSASKLVIRQKSRPGAACKEGGRVISGATEKQPGRGPDDLGDCKPGFHNGSSSSSSRDRAPAADSQRQFPPLDPAYLAGLQLLHERQRQRKVCKAARKKKAAAEQPGEATEDERPTDEILQLAAPRPFKQLAPPEALFASLSEYLGCLAAGLPGNGDCGWLREANRDSDPRGVRVASISGGLIHSEAVVSAANSLYHWVLAEGPGAWAAVSIVGTAEAPVAYTNQPHGNDLLGEATLHLLLTADQDSRIRGMLLQTISPCDATTTLP